MARKAQKELELKVHEEFYKNVHFLTLCYPPTQEFREVFKKDMFIKNNKAGFHQVVAYLLGVLDPDMLKKKVPTWPLFDIRLESQFRNEVMNYINELNSFYEDANIPKLVASHLISPGGFKFVKFMFKLSQLVLYEQLRRNPETASGMLLPMKPSKHDVVTAENLEKLQIMTSKVNEEINQIKTDSQQRFEAAKLEAQEIVEKQHQANQRFKDNQVKLQILKKQISREFPNFLTEQDTRLELEEKLKTLKQLKENFNKCEELGLFLNSSQAKLEHNKELKVPADISHIVRFEGDALDLSSLIEGCNMLTDCKRLEIRPLCDQELAKQIKRFEALNDKFSIIIGDMEEIHSELDKLSGKIQKETQENENKRMLSKQMLHTLQMENLTENDSDSTSSTPLAEPLPPSPSPDNKHKIDEREKVL